MRMNHIFSTYLTSLPISKAGIKATKIGIVKMKVIGTVGLEAFHLSFDDD